MIVGCVPPIRPLMERILQHLGLTSKKTSTPYYQSPNAYAAYGTNKSGLGNTSHLQSTAYGERKPLGRADEDLTWVEMTNVRDSSSSKDQIINGTDIMVTTEFSTQFEEHNGAQAGSSRASQTSGEGTVTGTTPDIQKVV